MYLLYRDRESYEDIDRCMIISLSENSYFKNIKIGDLEKCRYRKEIIKDDSIGFLSK